MAAVENPKWDTLPAILEIKSYDTAAKTLVANVEGEVQTTTNVFLEGLKALAKNNIYIHSAAYKAGVAAIIGLFHYFPQIATVLPLPSAEKRDALKVAIAAARS